MGVLEEGGKAVGGVVDALRQNPLALANIVLNIAFLVFLFYYVSIIARRAESTVKELFVAQDNVFKQWGTVVKDQQTLTEKTMHCILPEDALKLLQAPPRYAPEPPARPAPLSPSPNDQRGDLKGDPVGHLVEWQKLQQIGEARPFTFEQPAPRGPVPEPRGDK